MEINERKHLLKTIAIKSGDTAVILHNVEVTDASRTKKLFEKYYQINGLYSIRSDSEHIDHCQRHLHLFRGRTEIGAVNRDGSSHDNSNFRIPDKLAKFIKSHLPDYVIPPGRLVESKGIMPLQTLCEIAETPFEILVIDLDKIEQDEKLANLIEDLMKSFQR